MSVVLYHCKKCKEGFRVTVPPNEAHLLKRVMRCPHASVCGGKVYQQAETNIKPNFPVTQIGALNFFQACAGVGLPGEQKCGPKDLKKLLIGARVVDAHLETAPDPKRSLVFSLTLDNGKVLHLASSTQGATFYKLTEVRHGR